MAVLKKITQTFLGAEDSVEQKKKGAMIAVLFPAYTWFHWALVGVAVSITAFLKHHAVSGLIIFLVLWIGNMIICGAVILFNDESGIDLTLMEGTRRLIDKAIQKSRFAGLLVETLIIIWLIVWDGPDMFIIFYRQKLNGKALRFLAFIAASAFQMAIWTKLYIIGYTDLLHPLGAF